MNTENGDAANNNDIGRNDSHTNNHHYHHDVIGATIRICGTSWAPCGYCKGARSHLSSMKMDATLNETTKSATTTTGLKTHTMNNGDDDEFNVCKSSNDSTNNTASSSCIYAIYAKSMTPAIYEELLWKGWRRSGNTMYLPINAISCCPSYPIRLHVNNYQSSQSKSQRKLIHRIERIFHPPPPPCKLSLSSTKANARANEHPSTTTPRRNTTTMKRKCDDTLQPSHNRVSLHETFHNNDTTTILYDMIQQSNLMKEIYQYTKQAIQETLQEIITATTTEDSGSSIGLLLPSLSTWTIQYKPKRNVHHHKSRDNSNYNPNVTFVSSICAQLVGQSKGILLHDRRNQLVQQVVTKLRDLMRKDRDANHYEPQKPNDDTDPCIHIVSIDGHVESGQIMVKLQVNRMLYESALSTTNGKDTAMNDDSTRSSNTYSYGVDHNDRILHWWMSLYDDQTRDHHLDDHGHTRPIAALALPTPLPPSPPYRITITTVPAHTSALDPRVHQLYFLYQQVVHNEPNPLLQAFSTERNNNKSTVEHNPVVENDAMLSENDDPAFVDQGDGNMDKRNQPIWGHDSCDKAKVSVSIDWGQDGTTPVGWMEAVLQMLHQEYKDTDDEQRRIIYDAYGTFYEFLVENPFGNVTMLPETTTSAPQILPMGTYHQHYVLHDVLIAVGVIDILPTGLSSVYLFYHPSFAKDVIPMGKYAIFKEIECTKQQKLPYYYLGYYIHSCTKMSYKSQYDPSEILCPITHQWVDVKQAKRTIDRRSPNHNYCQLVPNDTEDMEDGYATSIGSTTISSTTSNAQQQKAKPHVASLTCDIENHIPLLVGYDTPMSLTMLHGPALQLVRPIIHDFIRHMGNNKDLVQKFIIDLVS